MTTIADERDLITKKDCDKKVDIMTDKIDDLKKDLSSHKIEIIREIAGIPNKLDKKYAGKYLEAEVVKIKEKREQRNYDWLKYVIVTVVAVAIAKFI